MNEKKKDQELNQDNITINIYCKELHIHLHADHNSAVSFCGEAIAIHTEGDYSPATKGGTINETIGNIERKKNDGRTEN